MNVIVPKMLAPAVPYTLLDLLLHSNHIYNSIYIQHLVHLSPLVGIAGVALSFLQIIKVITTQAHQMV